MLEVAVWIGVVVVGLAVLAFLEVLRSNSFIGAHREEIRMALPTVALCALASIARAGAMLFFFRFFLGDVWQYALPVAIFMFVIPVWRIWQQQSERALGSASGAVARLAPEVNFHAGHPRWPRRRWSRC